MKKVSLSALAICLGITVVAPVVAEEAGPSLEDTMEFLYDNMGETNGIVMNAAAGAGNRAKANFYKGSTRKTWARKPDSDSACLLFFTQEIWREGVPGTVNMTVDGPIPLWVNTFQLFLGGSKNLRVQKTSASAPEYAAELLVTDIADDGFTSLRQWLADGVAVEPDWKEQRNTRTVSFYFTSDDTATRFVKAMQHANGLCTGEKAPKGFGKPLF